MSQIITASTRAGAQALADKAQAYLSANCAGYRADRWDVPRQHPTNGKWAIEFDARIAGAFTPSELAATSDATDDWTPPAP